MRLVLIAAMAGFLTMAMAIPQVFGAVALTFGLAYLFVVVRGNGVSSCYNSRMGSKLSTANPYLRDPAVRQGSVYQSVASSSAIEGIRAPFRKTSDAAVKHAPGVRSKSNGKARLTRA